MGTTVLLVDDHPLFRKGIRFLLEAEGDMRIAGEACDGLEAITKARELVPDVVIMDITMPKLSGVGATRQILAESPGTKIIVLSIHGEKQFIEQMLEAGVAGYLLKDSIPEELVNGVRAVMRGEVVLSAEVAGLVVREYRKALSGDHALADRAEKAAPPLITYTKLHRPRPPLDLVHRPYLMARLEEGLRSPLTLLSAAAGFGKTTLLAAWLETCDRPSAWVQLDDETSDLMVFVSYFLAAIQTLFPDVGSHLMTRVQAVWRPPLAVLVSNLLDELALIEEPFVLVLDDYHKIQNEAVHELVGGLIKHLPPKMHLTIASRNDPPFPLTNLRASGLVQEIRTGELRFTPEDSHTFLDGIVSRELGRETTDRLREKTEGWITGLRLAALSMRNLPDVDAFVQRFEGSSSAHVADYLLTEVLERQRPEVQEFLLRTCLLDRFCAGLCDAVLADTLKGTGGPPKTDDGPGTMDDGPQTTGKRWSAVGRPSSQSKAMLGELNRANLFLVPLDQEGIWYRYHHLFQDLLGVQLTNQHGPDKIASLHTRASRWFAQNDLLDESFTHSLAAEDIPYAVQLVERNRHSLMNTEQWHRLKSWLNSLPPGTVDENPELLATRAWISEYQTGLGEAWALMDTAESLLSDLPHESPVGNEIQGEINAMRAEQFFVGLDGDRTLLCAQEALALLNPEAKSLIAFAHVFQALAYQMTGALDRGLQSLRAAIGHASFPQGTSYYTRLQIGLCFLYCIDGNLIRLKQEAQRCLKTAETHNLQESIVHAKQMLGIYYYGRNKLDEVVQVLEAVVDHPYVGRPLYVLNCAFALALTYAAQDRLEDAWRVVDSMVAFATEHNHMPGLAMARAFRVELTLRQGSVADALQRSKGVSYELLPPFWFFYEPQLTHAKLLLAQNTPESLHKATELLDQFYGLVGSIHNKRFQIDVLALQALLHDAQGDKASALEKLSQSLHLAVPGGFIRNYVDLGFPMARLLDQLRRQGVARDYIRQILMAFETEGRGRPADPQPLSVVRRPSPALVEPLTAREMEVLVLLGRRLSNREIARELVITVGTVGQHTNRIYGKLDVGNRRQAVARARSLGILSP